MSHFKTISSISTHNDKVVLEYLKELYPDLEDMPLNKSLKNHNIPINPKLDDIIGATLDNIKEKDLAMRLPSSLDDLPPRVGPPRNMLNRFLWKNIKIQPNSAEGAWFNTARALGLRTVLTSLSALVIWHLLKVFGVICFKKYAKTHLNENFRNGALAKWFNAQLEKIYREHPNYTNLRITEYRKTGRFNKNMAEWRDKTAKQIIRKIPKKTFDIVLHSLCKRIPLPGAFLYSIPAKLILAYMGVSIASGSLHYFLLEFHGSTVIIGLTITRLGFELCDPHVFVKRVNDGKIVKIDLPKVPPELYKITKQDILQFKKEGKGVEDLKKQIAVMNDKVD